MLTIDRSSTTCAPASSMWDCCFILAQHQLIRASSGREALLKRRSILPFPEHPPHPRGKNFPSLARKRSRATASVAARETLNQVHRAQPRERGGLGPDDALGGAREVGRRREVEDACHV